MKARMKENLTISVRLSKEEWNTIKATGELFFENRNVGYLNFTQMDIVFNEVSPYFKDLNSLDVLNKVEEDNDI